MRWDRACHNASGDDLYAFVLNGKTVNGFKLSAHGLEEEVRAFRESIERRATDTYARGQALYARLIQPLAVHIPGDTLTIAPHGALHYLPFGALENEDRYLIDRRGFLYAGARSIVASLWQVDDAATEQQMVSFYRHLDGHDKREALRLAQIETRARYPEPRYWAAFEITGRAD